MSFADGFMVGLGLLAAAACAMLAWWWLRMMMNWRDTAENISAFVELQRLKRKARKPEWSGKRDLEGYVSKVSFGSGEHYLTIDGQSYRGTRHDFSQIGNPEGKRVRFRRWLHVSNGFHGPTSITQAQVIEALTTAPAPATQPDTPAK